MKNKIGIASVVFALAIALTGCSSTAATSDPGITKQAPAPAPVVTPEESYLVAVHSQYNVYIESSTDSALLDIGRQVCTTLDSGYTISEVITYLAVNGESDDQDFYAMEGIVIGAAVYNLCPEYMNQVP